MSLLTANLPSSDEEDDDYDPNKDKTGEKEDRPQEGTLPKKAAATKRKRGAPLAAAADDGGLDGPSTSGRGRGGRGSAAAEEDGDDDEEEDAAPVVLAPSALAKKAKMDALWQKLNSKAAPKAAAAPAPASGTSTSGSGSAAAAVGGVASIAALCRQAPKKDANPDLMWMRSLGMVPKSATAPAAAASSIRAPANAASSAVAAAIAAAAAARAAPAASSSGAAAGSSGSPAVAAAVPPASSPAAAGDTPAGPSAPSAALPKAAPPPRKPMSAAARAGAAAAMAAVRDAASTAAGRNSSKVTLTETRKFAGKDIQVSVTLDKDSKEAQRMTEKAARTAAASGMDAFLAEVEQKKKVSVLDKSKMDWQEAKKGDASLDEELELHKRSGVQYLDKKDFLQRSELREYEQERDKRLASDMRTRGRM